MVSIRSLNQRGRKITMYMPIKLVVGIGPIPIKAIKTKNRAVSILAISINRIHQALKPKRPENNSIKTDKTGRRYWPQIGHSQ